MFEIQWIGAYLVLGALVGFFAGFLGAKAGSRPTIFIYLGYTLDTKSSRSNCAEVVSSVNLKLLTKPPNFDPSLNS